MSYVYFIKPVGLPGPIKIGHSFEPKARLGSFLAWSPIPLEIIHTMPGTPALERNIHECFVDCHSHREWFHPHPRLLGAVEALKEGTPVDEAIDLSTRLGSLHKAKRAEAAKRKGTPEETVAL